MFAAQLANWLMVHGHQVWAMHLTSMSLHKFGIVYAWAMRHGYVYQP